MFIIIIIIISINSIVTLKINVKFRRNKKNSEKQDLIHSFNTQNETTIK